MKKSRFNRGADHRRAEAGGVGGKVDEVCRKLGVTQTSFYRWKRKFGGMEVSDAKRLRTLEDENRRLKQMVADQALDIQALKLVITKRF